MKIGIVKTKLCKLVLFGRTQELSWRLTVIASERLKDVDHAWEQRERVEQEPSTQV